MPTTGNIHSLTTNLQANCCTSLVELELCSNDHTQVVLWRTIPAACAGNKDNNCYPLAEIIALNNLLNRPSGIVCHSCENEGCVISLRIDNNENTRFARIV